MFSYVEFHVLLSTPKSKIVFCTIKLHFELFAIRDLNGPPCIICCFMCEVGKQYLQRKNTDNQLYTFCAFLKIILHFFQLFLVHSNYNFGNIRINVFEYDFKQEYRIVVFHLLLVFVFSYWFTLIIFPAVI